MIGSIYLPQTWDSVLASAIRPNVQGIKIEVPNQTTVVTDTRVTDDSLFRGLKLIASGSAFGDTITVSVVDVDGVYAPQGTVLSTPVSNFNVSSDQQLQASYESIAPFKILGGLYIRVTYVSTGGILGAVRLGLNLMLATILF